MKPAYLKTNLFILPLVVALLCLLQGCVSVDTSGQEQATGSANSSIKNTPYFPTKFNDFEIPGELEHIRSKSMYINTASFTGGILHFTGRVEMNSLTDFFINSMRKNGWKLSGEVRYENILLAFTKPNKNCLLTIYQGEYGGKIQVYAYITEDVQLTPISEQNL